MMVKRISSDKSSRSYKMTMNVLTKKVVMKVATCLVALMQMKLY